MTLLTPAQKQIVPSESPPSGERRGERRHSQLINFKGIPRHDDLITARFLEQTPTVSLPLNTSKQQARAIPWEIQPTVDHPEPKHRRMGERIRDFIDGGFNANEQTWDQLLGLLLDDSVSIDTAALEFVPTQDKIPHPQTGEETYWLSEVYAVDGTIISKNLDEKDRIPEPPEAAYYKWGNRPNLKSDILQRRGFKHWYSEFQTSRLLSQNRQSAVPMTRDEMTVLETNSQPREISAYGRGIVQQVRPWAEILLNQDRANVRHFSDDEYSKGILNIGDQNSNEIERFREYWKDEIKGETGNKLPKIASDNVEFIPFNETLKELQYLESQEWYSKLVWMLFGETTSTIGLAEDANRSTAESHDEQVFFNTTKPRLEAIEEWINRDWLPKMREYWVADGELEFSFQFQQHPAIQERERRKRRDDLDKGLRTPNQILQEEGKDKVPWGDVPSEAVSAFSREHPEWVMENWGGVEDVPEAQSEDTGLFSHEPRGESKDGDSDVGGNVVDSDTTQPATPEEFDSETPDEAKPFGHDNEYDDFEECVSDNQDKDDPEAYCGWLQEETKDFEWALRNPEDAKDALRNERAGELPDLTHIVDAGAEAVGEVIQEAFGEIEQELETRWPEDGTEERSTPVETRKALGVDFDAILDGVDLTAGLTSAITNVVSEAMEEGAETEVNQIEDEIRERLGEQEAELIAAFNVEDTFAFERMQRSAASDMVTVNETIKEQIHDTLLETAEDGAGLQEATERLREEIDELSDSHARLVARTETLDASRHGSQALAESADAIGGKRWRASNDQRTRPWHEAMDGEVVAKDGEFMVPSGWTGEPDYQPSDYPRSAFVVGDDQPFNCRCVQQSVLADDMPDDTSGLADYDGIELRFPDKHIGDATLRLEYDLSHRQYEVREAHKDGQETFAEVWQRLRAEHSKTSVTDAVGVSKTTAGKWDDAVGV